MARVGLRTPADFTARALRSAASGADSYAGSWARARKVPNVRCVANWATFGRAAGSIRNQQMLDEQRPDLVLAFPGGVGTAHMVRIARAAGVTVVEVAR